MNDKPAVGRIVHFVLPDGCQKGEHRAAIIVRVFEGLGQRCNLKVFLDGSNDTKTGHYDEWHTSVDFSPAGSPGTWHWPERE